MRIIKSITGKGFSNQQKFISTIKDRSQKKLKVNAKFKTIVKNDKRSIVGFIKKRKACLKLIKPISAHEYFRVFWRHSRVQKEVKGNFILRDLGLKTPKIFDHGLGLLSLKGYSYLGYILMENLSRKGYEEAYKVFTNNEIDQKRKDIIFKKIIKDIKKMRNNQILFSDLHLNNILVNDKDNIAYIDTGISQFSFIKKAIFRKKFNQSMDKLAKCHSNRNGLTEEQKTYIKSLKF